VKNSYSIIKSPVITEKSTAKTAEGEKIFNVKVLDVNTNRVPGKMKRMGKHAGQKPTRKKAYISLREGDKIEIFEGV